MRLRIEAFINKICKFIFVRYLVSLMILIKLYESTLFLKYAYLKLHINNVRNSKDELRMTLCDT